MPGRVEGKVAFITGAARGQGRSHAVRLAREGADIIAIDLCEQVDDVSYPLATLDDLAETVSLVEKEGRRIVAAKADVRDYDAMKAVVDEGVAQFGRLDIVVANAGIGTNASLIESMEQKSWQDTIDINLTGVFLTAKVGIPHLIAGGRGGSIVLTSSVGGLKGHAHIGQYIAAKHGVIGLMRTLAIELGQNSIRVNSVCPTQVSSPMVMNEATYRLFRPDLENPTPADFAPRSQQAHLLPVPWMDSEDISNAVLFLTSDESRYITGVALPIDAGALLK